ncbi:phosphoribosyltransferase family protein [Phytomonospora sp. NPDC050363]|uniref:phosphoribosyltransferase family protein n=1 Tax=Phytomonospora sp. NPDC050363 TaxID=3155642 RepID=UPI0034062789
MTEHLDRARELLKARTTTAYGDRLATLHWWIDPELLALLGPALAELEPTDATAVAGVQSSGYLLGPLVAIHLGLGFVGVQKRPEPDGTITLAIADGILRPRERVLLVDDLVDTGAQAHAVRGLFRRHGAEWLGVRALMALCPSEVSADLGVVALI